MDCPTCRKIVFSGDQFCRHCGVQLPPAGAGARGEELLNSLRGAVDGAVAAVDRVWKQAEPHVQRAAAEAKPHIDSAVRAFDDAMTSISKSGPVTKFEAATAPAARAASQKARGAAGRASKAAKPVVADVAEAVEKGARKVKDRARRGK
jgi:hypothetical protein